MEPSLRVPATDFMGLQSERICPYTTDPMTDPVTLLDCGHSMDKLGVELMSGVREEKSPGPHVKLVTPITCPICRGSVKSYVKNWALKNVGERLDKMMPKISEEKIPQASKDPVKEVHPPPRGPYYTWPQRFGIAVSTALASAGAVYAPIHQFYNTAPKVSDPRWEFWKGWIPGVVDYSIRDNNVKVATITSIMTMTMALMCFTVTACILARRQH